MLLHRLANLLGEFHRRRGFRTTRSPLLLGGRFTNLGFCLSELLKPLSNRFRRRLGHLFDRLLRLGDLLKKGESKANVMLSPGDVIIIPESMF